MKRVSLYAGFALTRTYPKRALGTVFYVPNTPEGRAWLQQARSYLNRACWKLRPRGRGPRRSQGANKEFLRLWFIDHCDPYNDAPLPEAPADMVEELSRRYAEIFHQLTGESVSGAQGDIEERICRNLATHLRRAS